MRVFVYIVTAILFLLVTFFGLGPVIFADGTTGERLITLLVVLLIYLLLILILVWVKKKLSKKK
jgi:membrane protease YdiL (CAAX protease family)